MIDFKLSAEYEELLGLYYCSECGDEPHYILSSGHPIWFLRDMKSLVFMVACGVTAVYNDVPSKFPYFHEWLMDWMAGKDRLWERTQGAVATCEAHINRKQSFVNALSNAPRLSSARRKDLGIAHQELAMMRRHRDVLYLALTALRQDIQAEKARKRLLGLTPNILMGEYLCEVRRHRGGRSRTEISFNQGAYAVSNAPGALGVKSGSKRKKDVVSDIMTLRRRVVCNPNTP